MRPEVKAFFWQWREVVAMLALAALALWWALESFGAVAWVAWVAVAGFLALAFVAYRRAQFSRGGGGVGVVEIDEGLVRYFTAFTGGEIAVREMTSLVLVPARRGVAHWELESAMNTRLLIPVDAVGADALFDVFASLPGIETEHMLRQLRGAPEEPVVIWAKPAGHLH